MIGRLSGTIEHREADGSVIVDVNGVGYEVFLPIGAAGRAGSESGQTVSLHIHTHVREDAMTLFGFATAEDRAAFRALLKVSSIGPKLALAIIGVMNAAELQDAIARQDKTAFKGISGVGKRTIERILLDLEGKLDFAASGKTGVRLRAVPTGTYCHSFCCFLPFFSYWKSFHFLHIDSKMSNSQPLEIGLCPPLPA